MSAVYNKHGQSAVHNKQLNFICCCKISFLRARNCDLNTIGRKCLSILNKSSIHRFKLLIFEISCKTYAQWELGGKIVLIWCVFHYLTGNNTCMVLRRLRRITVLRISIDLWSLLTTALDYSQLVVAPVYYEQGNGEQNCKDKTGLRTRITTPAFNRRQLPHPLLQMLV